ncbi:PAS domain-containing hybrid sensor histidine kinase/response regulator [Adlercreutzia sp.]|uniref:PAS domain-containing hybrid sensor histidine kinase/response regulator n=1 Tax=Adlercreutzia sp. TaxID=1872387 RepID=UPI002E76A524|nr:ATP-binding protein [Adlercreutzia sp.]MEE0637252.1 response regulator [Adlercreutzia sp.]
MATSAPSIFPALAQLDIGDVLAHMPGGFFVYHADGDEAVVYVNEACLRIFGCADEEQFVALTGGTFPGMVHPEDIEAVEHSISRQIQADRYSMDYVEYRIIRRDGSVRWIEDYGHHVTLDAGEFFYVFINDATDKLRERADELEAVNAQLREAYARELEHRTMLRNALSEAEAANVAKNTFLSNMSHDIRTPLNAVVGYASLISAHGGEAERVRAYSDKVLAASEQLLDVVNETLEISRMEAGHVQLAEAECSLSELVMQVRMDMVDLADRADVTLACDIGPLAHDRVLVDAVRLSHVLTQLVDNAIKYSPAGSTVRISVAENAGAPQGFASFRFVVADKGVGMEPAFMERMFMPFERESNTTASGVQGTGLGLTIVRNVLDLMEGELAVESAPGEGSTFTVDITFRQAPADVAVEAPRPSRGRGPVHRILLVEDNELNREIACCLLDDAGYAVDTAENGEVAVGMIEEADACAYDLVLMDIQMPVMDGYAATRAIRALPDPLRASLPIIAVSANAFSEDRKRSLESGMDAHLPKPLDVHRLQSLIEKVVH